MLEATRLWPHLRKYGVINEDIQEEWESKPTNKEKVSKLIDHIGRGPTWRLHAFCRACKFTCQEHVISQIGLDPEDYVDLSPPNSDGEDDMEVPEVKRKKMSAFGKQSNNQDYPDGGAMLTLPDSGPTDNSPDIDHTAAQRYGDYVLFLQSLLGHSTKFKETELEKLHISTADSSFLKKQKNTSALDENSYILDHPLFTKIDRYASEELIKMISLSVFASKEQQLQKQVFALLSQHQLTDVMKAIVRLKLLPENKIEDSDSQGYTKIQITEPKFLLNREMAGTFQKCINEVQELTAKINTSFDELVSKLSATSDDSYEQSMTQSDGVEAAGTLLSGCSTQQQIQVGESTLGKIFPRGRCSIEEALSAGNNDNVIVAVRVMKVTKLQDWSLGRKFFYSVVADSTNFCTIKCYAERFYPKFTTGASLLMCNALSKSDDRLVLTARASVLATSEVVVPDVLLKRCDTLPINMCSHQSIADILAKEAKRTTYPAFVIAKVIAFSGVKKQNVPSPSHRRVNMRHLMLKDATRTDKVVLWTPEAEKTFRTGDVVKITHIRKGWSKTAVQLSTTKYDSVVEFLPKDTLPSVIITKEDQEITDPELLRSGTAGILHDINEDIFVYAACPARGCSYIKLSEAMTCRSCNATYNKPSSWGFTQITVELENGRQQKKAWMGALIDIGIHLGLPFTCDAGGCKDWVEEVKKHLPIAANFIIENQESCSAVLF